MRLLVRQRRGLLQMLHHRNRPRNSGGAQMTAEKRRAPP